MSTMTYQEVSKALAIQALKDPTFRKELVANPNAAIEKYSGQPLGSKVVVHENSDTELHFVLPPPINKNELSDEDLEKVAGGEFVIAAAVVGFLTGVFAAGVGIAADQTRARAGW